MIWLLFIATFTIEKSCSVCQTFVLKYQLLQIIINSHKFNVIQMNFGPKLDYNLKRSFVADSYQVQPQQSHQNRGNLTKRSSFTLLHDYGSSPLSTELPKTPKTGPINNANGIPFSMDQFQVATQYYHQSNYLNQIPNQHQVQNHQSFVQHNQYIPQPQNPTSVQMNQFSGYASRPQSSINRVQLSTSRAEQPHQKIEAFSLEQKKQSDLSLEQQIKQISQKLQKTVQRVTNQQQLLKKKPWQCITSPNPSFPTKLITETITQTLKLHEIEQKIQTNIIKKEIEEIRKEIEQKKYKDENLSTQMNNKIKKINQNLTKSIECVNGSLNTLVTNLVQIQNRKKGVQMERFRVQMERQIQILERSIQEKIRKDKEQCEKLTNCSSCEALPSGKVFIGDPILVKFATKVSVNTKASNKQVEQQQTIYKVDNEGYLLDFEGHYMVNSKYEQIKLSPQQINVIKNMGLLR